jgi:23S rRNA (guanine2445-N2)-methyltransferase / 23S rRNA (guanine2069-N7)-methyltransferase
MSTLPFIATCSRGLESVLAAELKELGMRTVEELRGAVAFGGDSNAGYRAVLWSRCASRVHQVLARFPAPDRDALYDGVVQLPWPDLARPDGTLAVDVVGVNPNLNNSQFTARTIKDAVVDRIRGRFGRRPEVDLDRPDLRLHFHLDGDQGTLSIDLAGDPLHLRGLDRAAGEAPIKETLAAAILRLSGFRADDERNLLDPMCGSGTFLVEAGMVRRDIAPGLLRRRWGFSGFLGHNQRAWRVLIEEAEARRAEAAGRKLRLIGVDRDPQMVEFARKNADKLGLDLRINRGGMGDARAPRGEPGLMVTNPPYGQRLGDEEEARQTLRELGDLLRHHFLGWTAFVLVGSTSQVGAIGLKPARRIPIKNGPLDARLVELRIRADAPILDTGPVWR